VTRPLLYVSNLVQDIDPDLVAEGPVETKVQAGIDRLVSMQTPSGGFGAWPGDTEPLLWGTAYVVHLLHDAKALGYKVPERSLADAIDWLDRNAGTDGGYKFHGTTPGYVYYVLARVGKPHSATAIAMIQALPAAPSADGSVEENRMLLQAAVQTAGDHRYAKQLENVDLSPITEVRHNDWTYYSDLRRRGLTLAVFHELFGAKPAGIPLADLVADRLSSKPGGYWVTNEIMWGVTGLGKFVQDPPKGLAPPKLSWDGKAIPLAKTRAGKDGSWTWQVTGAASAKSLVVTVPAGAGDRLSLVASTEGVQPSRQLQVGGNGLTLKREVLDGTGSAADLLRHDVGDLLFVRLSLSNDTSAVMENVALVDPVPAGWEIENPRLGRGSVPDWVDADGLWTLEYMDLKDDRFQAFGKLEQGQTASVVYAVRAVTAGTFALRGASAEAMYDPRYWARTAAWTARVRADWAAID
jgi:alpha-2-macroglobulin